MRILSSISWWLAAGALALSLAGCDSSADEKVALAKLSSDCRINSDCGQLLVCVFERCHEECESSRDCEDGARCVQGPHSRNVCQLPDEQACGANGACPGDQVCGIDAECRDACRSDGECLSEQLCSAGTCADLTEVDDVGRLEPSPERPTTALAPCAFDSDCPGREICSSGACKVECRGDAECGETEQCVEQACEALPVAKPCLRHSDCAQGNACQAGQCRAVEPELEPECGFDSDCPSDGQHCRGGRCVCECSTAADCSSGQTCRDGCACKAGRVIDGDVQIRNERELELIRDVVEITGRLELAIGGAAEYHLPNLRKVGTLGALGALGIIWLEGLEEAVGALHCFQDCRLPRLRRAGALTLASETFTTIELPALETVSGALNVWYCANLGELWLPELKSAKELRVQTDVRLTKLEIPKLESTEVLGIVGNDRLQTISLPVLSPSFDIDISNNPALEALSLPALESFDGRLTLFSNAALQTVDFPALNQARDINVQLTPKLRSLSLPALTRVVGNFYFSSTSGPEVLDLPVLTRVGSLSLSATKGIKSISAPLLLAMNDLFVSQTDMEAVDLPLQSLTGQLALDANDSLSTLALRALTSADRLSLSALPALTDMDLSSLATTNDVLITKTGLTNLTSLYWGEGGALKSAGNLEITFNPALPVCAVGTLTAKLTSQGWNNQILAQDNLQCDCNGAFCQ